MSQHDWTREWPQSEGVYWLYGVRSRYAEKPQLMMVRVRKGANALVCVAEGAFLYQDEGAGGMWMPVDVPSLPVLETPA